MGKQGKSSASSATRKKHQKKANALDPSISIAPSAKSQGKGKGKGKNKEPRVKQYIPPPKFKPLVEDPIDGLATTGVLPPNMVLSFKGLSKKDPVTKTKALEELISMLGDESWSAALPVWLWHFVPLSVHPSRRIRELNASLHSKLTAEPGIQDELQTFLLSHSSASSVLAAWILGANEAMPSVASSLRSSWNSNVLWRQEANGSGLLSIQDHVEDVVSSVLQAVAEPDQLYQQFAPLAVALKDGSDANSTGEHPEDRVARIRTSGLGVLGWILEAPPTVLLPQLVPSLANLFASNPLVGSILSSSEFPSFLPAPTDNLDGSISFGYGQRGVRIAGWSVVKAIVKHLQHGEPADDRDFSSSEDSLKPVFLSSLGVAALRSAWIEPDAGVRTSMWEGLLLLITVFPDVWSIVSPSLDSVRNDEEVSDSEDEDDDAVATPAKTETQDLPPGHAAYMEFLRFLELGCHGSAVQSYPAVMIVLSTIPLKVLTYDRPGLERFFTSFWAAYDSNALSLLPRDREPIFKSFVSAFLECIVFICRNLARSVQPNHDGVSLERGALLESTVATWIGQVLSELVQGNLVQSLSVHAAGALVGASITKLEQIDRDAVERAWSSKWESIFTSHESQALSSIRLLASMMTSVVDTVVSGRETKRLLEKAARLDDNRTKDADALLRQAQVLSNLWQHPDLSNAPWLAEATTDALSKGLMQQLVSSGNGHDLNALLNGFLNAPPVSDDTRSRAWSTFLRAAIHATSFELLRDVLDSVQFSLRRPIEEPDLYACCKSWITSIIQGDDEHLQQLISVLGHWDICLSQPQAFEVLETLGSSFIREAGALISTSDYSQQDFIIESTSTVLFFTLENTNTRPLLGAGSFDLAEFGAFLLVLPALGIYLPTSLGRLVTRSGEVLRHWLLIATPDMRTMAEARGREHISGLLTSCNTSLSASNVLDVATRSGLYADDKSILLEVLPPQTMFDTELEDLADIPSSLLAEGDPLVQLAERDPTSSALLTYDTQGLSKYARLGAALDSVLSQNRHLAKEQLWTFRHLLMLQQLGLDFVAAPFWPSDAFRQGSRDEAKAMLDNITQLVIYLGNSLLVDLGPDWHRRLAERLRKPAEDLADPKNAQDIVFQIYSIASRPSARLRDVRLLRRVMQMTLRDVESETLDLWAGFAQSIHSQRLLPAQAIGSVVASRGVESLRLDRWRNELASRLAGISPSSANNAGLPLLQMLNSLAPPADSGIIYLPQQRAVFLVQALQKWMTSDEDLDDTLETHVTVTLYHLLPILQTVPGAHWEFILDILENNLGVPGGATSANVYLLLQTLRAIMSVHELSQTNESLEEIWKPRQSETFQTILTLFLAAADNTEPSSTRDKYHICLVDAMQNLPSRRIKADLFDQLLSLTSSENIPIKATAHQLVRNALVQITEQRVLEAAVNLASEEAGEEEPPTDNTQFELPQPIIERLVPLLNKEPVPEDQLNLLLSWWIALEFFDNSSLKIKQGYLEQLRRLEFVKLSLLPCLFDLLGIGTSGSKSFGLLQWYVEEYHFNLFDTSLPSALNVLAAHIYYKALKSVPGLIRTWWTECQDKQLSSSLSTYTKTYFSPVLIKQELAQFRSSAASASEALADDAFAVKVAPSVNEISAVYTVDDQTLEVAVRLPPEFPLRPAEVRDVRGIAGMENRRRAWVFGVQQTAQQGLIYDALAVYKKNIAGHFEGKSECAICYSLISVTDRTLPTKPCRTCKNRFHSSCLYKWFNTSHSSTCPLCRSDIF